MNFHGKDIKIFTCNSNIPVARQIASCLSLKVGNAEVKHFSDGEIAVSINESVRGSDVFIVQSTCAPVNDNLMELPAKINSVNYSLMLETMAVCYEQIQENNSDIESIGKWIDEIRIELKKKVALKQHKMIRNQNFYTYMHNIFGAEVINIFDMKYHVEQVKKPQLKEEKTTEK